MKKLKYGWHSGIGKQLFVWQNGIHWGVTQKFSEGTSFKNINECIEHWLGKHRFPEQYQHLLHEGHLQFFNAKTKQQIIFIPEMNGNVMLKCNDPKG